MEEPAPAPPAPEEGSEPAEPPAPLVFELGELQRIKVMINDISEATSVMPSVRAPRPRLYPSLLSGWRGQCWFPHHCRP